MDVNSGKSVMIIWLLVLVLWAIMFWQLGVVGKLKKKTKCFTCVESVSGDATGGNTLNVMGDLTVIDGSYSLLSTSLGDGFTNFKLEPDNYDTKLILGNSDNNLKVMGQLSTGELNADSVNVTGELNADSVNVTEQLSAGTADVTEQLSAGTADVTGKLSAGTADVTGKLSAGTADVTGDMTLDGTFTMPGAAYSNPQIMQLGDIDANTYVDVKLIGNYQKMKNFQYTNCCDN